ncbi:hypothetical protein Goshw_014032 [Gossypium schwendimanii]|uniref:Uncharacterized protein n=1 Tax=Gossypium schwendimanii TaxID=34291 RepID=A0A7J9N003_GOSSC|nr:hypothetical protein [Gossypium schwendimanii]
MSYNSQSLDLLNFSWIMNNMSQSMWEWLTWVFKRSDNGQCLLF